MKISQEKEANRTTNNREVDWIPQTAGLHALENARRPFLVEEANEGKPGKQLEEHSWPPF